jgi:Ca-activated chloride channel family protein
LESTLSVVLRGVKLELTLASGVKVRRAYRMCPLLSELEVVSQAGDRHCFTLGDLEREQRISLLLEIVVPPTERGDLTLFEAVVSGTVAGLRGGRETQCLRAGVRVTDDAQVLPPNAEIMRLVETAQSFKLQTQALSSLAAGDVNSATIKLKAASTRLLSLGEMERADALESEIAHLNQTGRLSTAGAKQLRYDAGKMTRKLG